MMLLCPQYPQQFCCFPILNLVLVVLQNNTYRCHPFSSYQKLFSPDERQKHVEFDVLYLLNQQTLFVLDEQSSLRCPTCTRKKSSIISNIFLDLFFLFYIYITCIHLCCILYKCRKVKLHTRSNHCNHHPKQVEMIFCLFTF